MSAQIPPSPGVIYAAKLPNGLFAACQVIRADAESCLALCLEGNWPQPPRLEDAASAGELAQQRQFFSGMVARGIVTGPPPESFISVGRAQLSPTRAANTKVLSDYSWERLVECNYLEWRWVHDRAAFEAEVKAREKLRKAARKEANSATDAEREKRLNGLTLQKFRSEKLFPNWSKLPGKEVAAKAQSIFEIATDELLALGEKRTAAVIKKILKRVITDFNALDKAHNGCIETGERENILEHFQTLADLVAYKGWKNLFAERDW